MRHLPITILIFACFSATPSVIRAGHNDRPGNVMGQLQAGHFLFLEDEKLYFCAKEATAVLRDVKSDAADGK